MKRCFLCKKEMKQNESSHIKKCAQIHNIEFDKELLKFKQIQYEYLNILDCSSNGINTLLKNGMVLKDFEYKYNLKESHYYFLIKYHNLKIDKELYNKNVQKNRKKTNMKKYGVESTNSLIDIKKKKIETCMKKFGVDNPAKNSNVINKMLKTKINKYGKNPNPFKDKSSEEKKKIMEFCWDGRKKMYNNLSTEDKLKMIDDLKRNRKKWWDSLSENEIITLINKRTSFKKSKIETRICDILEKMNIDFQYQFWINRKSYDIRISNTNVIIEINGDYWHANPLKYTKDQIISFPEKKLKVSDIWERDELKRKMAEDYGYVIFYIWESDMKKYTDNELMDIIKSYFFFPYFMNITNPSHIKLK